LLGPGVGLIGFIGRTEEAAEKEWICPKLGKSSAAEQAAEKGLFESESESEVLQGLKPSFLLRHLRPG
jgi:hypothetical protein